MDRYGRPVHARPDNYFSSGPATVVARLEVTPGRVQTPLTSPPPPLVPGDREPTGREDGRPAVEGVTNWLYHRPSTTVPFLAIHPTVSSSDQLVVDRPSLPTVANWLPYPTPPSRRPRYQPTGPSLRSRPQPTGFHPPTMVHRSSRPVPS